MKQIVNRLSLILAALAPTMLGAQAMAPARTYTVISVYRETVKAGKNVAHDLNEEAWARAVAGAKPPAGYLALSAMSGAPENWYISAFENWAALETANRATEASPALTAIGRRYSARESDFLSDGRAMLLTVREDLSFGRPADLAASRYFSVTRVTVRPGHAAEYEENRKMIRAAHERTGLSDGYSIWQAASGAPVGTYFVFVARKLLGEIDASTAPQLTLVPVQRTLYRQVAPDATVVRSNVTTASNPSALNFPAIVMRYRCPLSNVNVTGAVTKLLSAETVPG